MFTMNLPAKNLEDLQVELTESIGKIAINGEQAVSIAEITRVAMGEYGRLLEEGQVPEDKKYKFVRQ